MDYKISVTLLQTQAIPGEDGEDPASYQRAGIQAFKIEPWRYLEGLTGR